MKTTQQRPLLANMEDLHGFLVSKLRTANQPLTFFVGAGVSIPPPSCLPSAASVITLVIEALCIDPEMDTYQRNLPKNALKAGMKMELLFDIIQHNIGSRLNALFSIFDEGEPNLYHHFLARILETNLVKHVVTTNFDRLIEKGSIGNLFVRATESEHYKRYNRSLFKIHGTIDRPETIIAVLPQISRGLGLNKRQLLKETLESTCVVIGWGDDDIDLTPSFFEFEGGDLIWFHYAPHLRQVTDFLLTSELESIPNLQPKIQLILQKRSGVLVACDPMPFFLDIWYSLKEELGPIPTVEAKVRKDVDSIVRNWGESLEATDRLIIVGDILRHLVSWNEAINLYRKAENQATSPWHLFKVHCAIGDCFTRLANWEGAYQYFHLALQDRGYPPSIETLLDDCPRNPEIAPLYGKVGILLEKIGRFEDAAKCLEMDMELCMHFELEDQSQACINYADVLAFLGKQEKARKLTEKGINQAGQEGNILAKRAGYSVLADLAVLKGDLAEAEFHLRKTLEIDEVIGRMDLRVCTLNDLAGNCCKIEAFENALRYVDEALEIAKFHNLRDLQAEVLMTKGIIEKEKTCRNQFKLSFSDALPFHISFEAYTKALELVNTVPSSNIRLKSAILDNRGLLYYLQGDYHNALCDLEESLQLRTQIMDKLGRANILDNLALVFIKIGVVEKAEGFLQEALSIYEQFINKEGQCQVLNDLGGVYATKLCLGIQMSDAHQTELKDYFQKAITFYKKSLELAKQLKNPVKVMQAEHNLEKIMQLFPDYLFTKGGSHVFFKDKD